MKSKDKEICKHIYDAYNYYKWHTVNLGSQISINGKTIVYSTEAKSHYIIYVIFYLCTVGIQNHHGISIKITILVLPFSKVIIAS